MKHQSSNLPKMKLNPLESATRTKDDEDGSILMVVNPTKEDWAELRNKYTSQRAFETRQVLTGMPLQQALLGLIFWLKSKNVVFYTNLKDREVLKFSWGGKLAVVYCKNKTQLGEANPAGHKAVDAYMAAIKRDKENKEALEQKVCSKYNDPLCHFSKREVLLQAMHLCADFVRHKPRYPDPYTAVRDYVYLKMSIASFAFRFDPFDIYYDWLQEYKAKHKITDVLKDMEDCRNANTTARK